MPKGPIIFEGAGKSKAQIAAQAANDTVESFYATRGEIQRQRHAEEDQDFQRQDEARAQQAFDASLEDRQRVRQERRASQEINTEIFKDQARQAMTMGAVQRSLAKGLPVPPDPKLVRSMLDRLAVVKQAAPKDQERALAWMQAENAKEALAVSSHAMRVQIEDLQRLGAFGEDEETLALIDGLKDDAKGAESMTDLREIRKRVDALRSEMTRQRDVNDRFQQGLGLLEIEAQGIAPHDPRMAKLSSIKNRWLAGGFDSMDDLGDAVFKAKYDRETAREAEKRWAKAVELATEENGGLVPAVDAVEAWDRILKDPRAAQMAVQGGGGGLPAQTGAPRQGPVDAPAGPDPAEYAPTAGPPPEEPVAPADAEPPQKPVAQVQPMPGQKRTRDQVLGAEKGAAADPAPMREAVSKMVAFGIEPEEFERMYGIDLATLTEEDWTEALALAGVPQKQRAKLLDKLMAAAAEKPGG